MIVLYPQSTYATEAISQRETIRVGFFEMDGYHMQDETGKRSGYGYDTLRLMARYWNVRFEYIGYDKSAKVVKEAYKRGCSIKEIILEEKLMTEDEFAEAVRMK